MSDDSTIKNVLGIFGKVILGTVALGTAAAFATAYYAGKAGQQTRERLDETVDHFKEQTQETMGSLTGGTGSTQPSV